MVKIGLAGENFDVAGGKIWGRLSGFREEDRVGEGKGVEGDAVRGEEREVGVGGVVEEGGGEEAARGGNETRGSAVRSFGGNKTAGKDAGERWDL